MSDFALSLEEMVNDKQEPRVTFVLTRGEQEVLRRDARAFSEDDMIAVSNELTEAASLSQIDVDQYIAELIEPVRIRWLRSRERPDENQAERPQGFPPRY